MLSFKFIKFMKALKSGRAEKLSCVTDLGRVGIYIAEEYSTRFDLLNIEQCLFLSEFQTTHLEKEEKHLLNLVKKDDPLFSLLEYYDNYPYAYSDINCFFKGCLKSGVEISIKAVNPVSKNNCFKKLNKIEKTLKYQKYLRPWINKEYKIEEILTDLKERIDRKFVLGNEIRYTKNLIEYLDKYKEIKFLKRIKFPKIYAYLSSDDKVVTEFVYGSYFYELLQYNRLSYKDVLDLIRTQLFFILKVGVFHNNLHSGNLILSDEGNIHFLDCNTISILTTQTKEGLFKLLKYALKRDFRKVTEIFNDISKEKISQEQLEYLVRDMEQIFNSSYPTNNTLVRKLMEMFRLVSSYGVVFEKDIFTAFKSLIYLEKISMKTIGKNGDFREDLMRILEEIEGYIEELRSN